MIVNIKDCYLVKNSKDVYYKFFIQNNNLIMETYSDIDSVKTNVLKNSVIDYSVDIDNNDTLHIIYLTQSGKLNYLLYPYDKVTSLTQFDINKLTVKSIKLKIINEDIHIFYILNHYYSKSGFIYHNIWKDNKWSNTKITGIKTKNYSAPYFIDSYKDNIYLFYSESGNESYKIKKFNNKFLIWGDFDRSINLHQCNNISFFINNYGIAIICYSSSANKSLKTFIVYKNLNLNSNWSREITISDDNSISVHPAILCDNDYTYIMWQEGKYIAYKRSKYGTDKWSKKYIISNKEKIFNPIYVTNEKNSIKSTFIFSTLTNTPHPLNLNDTIDDAVNNPENTFNNTNTINSSNILNSTNAFTDNTTFNNSFKSYSTNNYPSNINNVYCDNTNVSKVEEISDNADIIKKDSIEDFNNSMKIKDNYISQLLNIINKKDTSLKELDYKISELKNEFENIKSNNDEISTLSKQSKNLQYLNSLLSKNNKELKEQVSNLLKENESFKESINNKVDINNDETNLNNLLQENSELKDENSNLLLENKTLKDKVSDLINKNKQLQSALNAAENKYTKLKTQLSSTDKDLNSKYENIVKQYEYEMFNLNNQKEEHLKNLQGQILNLNSTIENLQVKNESQKSKITDLQSKLNNKNIFFKIFK